MWLLELVLETVKKSMRCKTDICSFKIDNAETESLQKKSTLFC